MLIGEYAVLHGASALIATMTQRFGLKRTNRASNTISSESPASKLLRGVHAHYEFSDPFEGRGGFGASSAQFAMAYAEKFVALGREDLIGRNLWRRVWTDYRFLHEGKPVLPSGADLIAQWFGGLVRFNVETQELVSLKPGSILGRILVFSGCHQEGRKVPTHMHLSQLSEHPSYSKMKEQLPRALDLVRRFGTAIEQNDEVQLSQAMNQYREWIESLGFCAKQTRSDVDEILKIPGVLAAKGIGALHADGILVFVQGPHVASPESIAEACENLGLKWIKTRLGEEAGLTLEEKLSA